MNRVIYALQFYREPGKREDDPAFANSVTFLTRILPDGIHSLLDAIGGETAEFRSSVSIVSEKEGTFLEQGTIRFGRAGSVKFSTIGLGYLRQSQEGNLTPGTVMWQIDSGDGVFDGVYGAITSNFLVNLDTNELVDNHLGVIYVK